MHCIQNRDNQSLFPMQARSRQASRTNFAQRSKMVTLVGPLTRPTCSGASAAVGPVNLTGTCRSTPRRGNGAGAALVPTNGTARPHQRQLVERGAKRCTVYHRKFTGCMNATPILEGDLETLLAVLPPRLGSSLRYMYTCGDEVGGVPTRSLGLWVGRDNGGISPPSLIPCFSHVPPIPTPSCGDSASVRAGLLCHPQDCFCTI